MEFYIAMAAVQVLSSRAQARRMRKQSRIAAIQGQIQLEAAEFQARMELQAGQERATFIRSESRRQVSRAVVQVGTSGVELTGSPLIAIAEQIEIDERAASTVITNAKAAAFSVELGGRVAQVSAQAEADRLRDQAGFTETAGWLGAASTIFAGDTRQQSITGESTFF